MEIFIFVFFSELSVRLSEVGSLMTHNFSALNEAFLVLFAGCFAESWKLIEIIVFQFNRFDVRAPPAACFGKLGP